jgi:hypothetical protein
MIEVKLIDKYPGEVMEIVKEIRKMGYVQGIDFDFEYHKPRYNDWSGDAVYNRHTIFTFYKNEIATWFSLRYL